MVDAEHPTSNIERPGEAATERKQKAESRKQK
jgi:hypothetical protein